MRHGQSHLMDTPLPLLYSSAPSIASRNNGMQLRGKAPAYCNQRFAVLMSQHGVGKCNWLEATELHNEVRQPPIT